MSISRNAANSDARHISGIQAVSDDRVVIRRTCNAASLTRICRYGTVVLAALNGNNCATAVGKCGADNAANTKWIPSI